MDPITLVFIFAAVGAWHSMRAGGRAVKAARAAASKAAVPAASRNPARGRQPGGGMPGWLTHRRHTGTAWWAGEIGHGFPVFRAGLSEGWTHHQTAMAERQAQAARARADGTDRQLTYKQERQQHEQRMSAARLAAGRQRIRELDDAERKRQQNLGHRVESCPVCGLYSGHMPGMSCASQPSAASPRPGHPVMAPPPQPSPSANGTSGRGGQPAARPAPPATGTRSSSQDTYIVRRKSGYVAGWFSSQTEADDFAAECNRTVPDDPAHAEAIPPWPQENSTTPNGQPSGQPSAPSTGGSMSDSTYESTEATLSTIAALLDHMVNDDSVKTLENLADQLPASLPDDSETVGHVADAAAAVAEMRAAQSRAQDAIAAAEKSHEANNKGAKEAADATGGAPERKYVTGG